MTGSNKPGTLSVIDKESINILDTVAKKSFESFNKVHDSATGADLDYDRLKAEAQAGAVTIKALMSKAHLSNAGQRVIENVKTKQTGK